MALYRQGSGSVQVDRATFRASHGNVNGNVSNGSTTRYKLNRGKRFSRVASIRQCSLGIFILILFTIVGLTFLGNNYPFSDKGEQDTSESGDLYDHQVHSTHFSFWNSRRQDSSLAGTNEKQWNSGDNVIPEKRDRRKQGHISVDNSGNQNSKVLHFGQGSVGSGRDSRYWDRDDRRRDEEYDEDSRFSNTGSSSVPNRKIIGLDDERNNSTGDRANSYGRAEVKKAKLEKHSTGAKFFIDPKGHVKSNGKPDEQDFGNGGLYNEKGRDELKLYEAKYEAALKNELDVNEAGKKDSAGDLDTEHEKAGFIKEGNEIKHPSVDGRDGGNLQTHDISTQEQVDVDDEYDDGIDEDIRAEEIEAVNTEHDVRGVQEKRSEYQQHYEKKNSLNTHLNVDKENSGFAKHKGLKRVLDSDFEKESSLFIHGFHQDKVKGTIVNNPELEDSSRKADVEKKKTSLNRRSKRRKHASISCDLRFLSSTVQLVEPGENPKFANFSLQYVESEEAPDGVDNWKPRFGGHQSLDERENSFYARDQKLSCGFVKGPKGSPSTGFDLSEEDAEFLNTCHIAVSSCIFGNSDNLRTPTGKKVTRSSKKNVCFVMFVDEKTLNTMTTEGRQPDEKGFIGLWKIVVVRNLPYTDMRRTGKIPKFLTHRLFPSARYSIWLDSKLRLQSDPLLILEYFLWRRSYEYAISNHYDRHCVWEEVVQNKRLNKFNHSIIDDQFAFYQEDGLTRFNASDPNKLLPSHVPEGSFIVRAHTPMSNLFSCLWFNEVDRFTPRDQLSFAYTYLKLRRMNPEKHFHLNMFKDCERRGMAKLFHHRTDEKPPIEGSFSLQ
eukprot:Gb_41794 [translate_table: standard]